MILQMGSRFVAGGKGTLTYGWQTLPMPWYRSTQYRRARAFALRLWLPLWRFMTGRKLTYLECLDLEYDFHVLSNLDKFEIIWSQMEQSPYPRRWVKAPHERDFFTLIRGEK